ncbi:MAG: MATE family efflux transporter, partial [Erysipelotrichaceae bacterium]|nr:MATE family efflux transporter [Erysipelotrichaceae bacterium]
MYASIFSTVICRVAFSVFFGVYLNFGVTGIAIAMVGDWAVKSILIMKRYHGGKWQDFRIV